MNEQLFKAPICSAPISGHGAIIFYRYTVRKWICMIENYVSTVKEQA